MCEVHSNLALNLSATANTGNQRSWFYSRKPESIYPCVVRPQWKGCHGRQYIVANPQLWHTRINLAPVNTRAWVIQERLLAPRVLRFGQTQLYWECRELSACELYLHGLPNAYQE